MADRMGGPGGPGAHAERSAHPAATLPHCAAWRRLAGVAGRCAPGGLTHGDGLSLHHVAGGFTDYRYPRPASSHALGSLRTYGQRVGGAPL